MPSSPPSAGSIGAYMNHFRTASCTCSPSPALELQCRYIAIAFPSCRCWESRLTYCCSQSALPTEWSAQPFTDQQWHGCSWKALSQRVQGVPHGQNAVSMTCQKEVGKGYNKDFENALEEETQIFLGGGFTTERHTILPLLRVGVVSEENRNGVRQELKAHTVVCLHTYSL